MVEAGRRHLHFVRRNVVEVGREARKALIHMSKSCQESHLPITRENRRNAQPSLFASVLIPEHAANNASVSFGDKELSGGPLAVFELKDKH
jgi:hypothetical protein